MFPLHGLPRPVATLLRWVRGSALERAAGQTLAPADVGLRQRLWPMVEMLRRAHAPGEPVVWGV